MSTIKNYSKLMEDLSKWKTNPSLWYDVTSYTSSTPSYNTYGSNFPIIIPFKVVDEISKREIEIPIEVKFSNEKGDVAINPNGKVVWNVNINVSQKEITYQLKYPFENFYTNKDEYAIIIETKSSFYFYQMLKYLKMNVEKGTASLNYILSSFKRAFTEAESSDEKLDWLYENALNVAIVDRGNDKLLSDMQTLSKYDRNKWFIDTGSGIVNLLQGFSDLKLVYDFFKNNPKITFEIYNTISDYENKKFFSQFILAIGFLFMPENLKGMPIYIKGDGYVLARYVDASQNEEKPFRLLNYVLRSVATPEDLKKQKARNVNYDGVQISIEERQLSPLDWVIVTNANVKKSSKSQLKSLPMPALYAYYLVDQKDNDNLMQDLRISLDILAIIAGVATFGAATGITAVIIALDIGFAATDLILMNDEVKDFLSQYEGGAWFVENWDIIYAVVGLGMITTLLLRGIAQNGTKLLEALKKVKNIGQKKRIFIKQLEDLITKATAYEAKNAIALEEVVVKSESSLQKILKLAFSSTDDFIEYVAKNLKAKGLTVRKVEDGVFEVLYKGVVVESGTEQKVGAFLRKMYYSGPRNAGKVLQEFLGKYHIKSFLESEALTAEKLVEWETKIKIFSKSKCRFKIATNNKAILKYMDEENSLAFFDASQIPPIIWYREGATEYVISHEFYHLEEFEKIGKQAFLKGLNGGLEEILLNDLYREKYVYEKILENSDKFTLTELKHAKGYFNSKLRDLVENGFELKPEYLIKK